MNPTEKPVQGTPAAVPVVPAVDNNTMALLIQLLLAERQDALETKAEVKKRHEAREQQRRIQSQYNEAEQKQREALCTHKKGGRGPKSGKIDYAVYYHTFIDQSFYIRCQICHAKWKPTDTDEFLVRRGKKIPNHTGIGWKGALAMLENTTNKPSSSEIPLVGKMPVAPENEFEINPHAVEV